MRAWLLNGFTDVTSMAIGEFPEPTAKAGEVVLALKFAALNPADRYLSINQYPGKPAFPHILGRDGVGTVVSVGEGVTDVKVGDVRAILRSEVGVNVPGTLAEKVAVRAEYTVPIPEGWSLEQSAAAPLVYLTAWQAIHQWATDAHPLPEKAVVLITGASGGVGVASVQLAHAMGYTVVVLSRSAEKAAELKKLGADFTFSPEKSGWRKDVRAALSTRRVDLAIDSVGGSAFAEVIDTLAMWGKVSVVGRLAGLVPDFNTASLFFRCIRIGGVSIAAYTNEESISAWKNVLQTLKKTNATPLIDSVFSFEEVIPAFERLQQGPMGKVLVKVN